MALNHSTDPNLANIQTTKKIPATPAKYSSATGTASMFADAKNPLIMGGTFNNTHNTNNFHKADGLNVLRKRVAPNAILNAGGRADEVRCHPGTREEVIGRIEKWRDSKDDQTPPIFWLSGPAGAGKSAIMQTIAERCKAQDVPQANFFFFRTDGSRRNVSPLVATLLHQVIRLYPLLRNSIAGVFSDDPLILDSILDEQLAQLLITPLRAIQQSDSAFRPILLLIDGLDECDSSNKNSQRKILRAFDKVFATLPCPFRLLVASRDESTITSAFNEISCPFHSLYLDSKCLPEHDIRLFVNSQFKHVRMTHPLSHTLDATWPSVKDVEGIVEKSSGQFIYAATVMRFISDSSASPELSLKRVQGAARLATESPFSHLDAIYTYILSQVDDQEALQVILHSQLTLNIMAEEKVGSLKIPALVNLLQILDPRYAQAFIRSCLADLTSIAKYSAQTLLFHHASFSDYLKDKSRSGDYFVDVDAFCFKTLPSVFKGIEIMHTLADVAIFGVSRLKKLPPDFLNTLRALDPSTFNKLSDKQAVFTQIYKLCACDDDRTTYKWIIREWINTLGDSAIIYGCQHDIEFPPCCRRYLMMAHIKRNFAMELSDEIATALRPETDFDIRETALWLDELLHHIQRQYYGEIGIYQKRLKQWIFWAIETDIPLNIPWSGRYSMMARIKRDVSIQPRDETAIVLRPDSDFDALETNSWLSALLHQVHREKYGNNVQHYQQLLKGWISWAVRNDIPLDGLEDLPGAQWYLRKGRFERWVARHLKVERGKR